MGRRQKGKTGGMEMRYEGRKGEEGMRREKEAREGQEGRRGGIEEWRWKETRACVHSSWAEGCYSGAGEDGGGARKWRRHDRVL